MLAFEPEKWTMQGILWGLFYMGVLMGALGLIWAGHTALFLMRVEKTAGVIVNVVAKVSSRSPSDKPGTVQPTNYFSVVEFTDLEGTRQQSESARAAYSDHYKRGDPVKVYYDPQEPRQAFIRDAWILWFSPGVIVLGALIWLAFAGGALLLNQRFDAHFEADKSRFLKQLIRPDNTAP